MLPSVENVIYQSLNKYNIFNINLYKTKIIMSLFDSRNCDSRNKFRKYTIHILDRFYSSNFYVWSENSDFYNNNKIK